MTEPCYICKDDPKFRPFCSRCGGTGQHSPAPPSSKERAAVEFAMRQGERCRNYGPEHERTENENCIVILAEEVERLRKELAGFVPMTQEELREHAKGAVETKANRSVTLNGYQLKAALEFIAPDNDPDQLESEVSIQWGDAGHSGAGYYACMAEYPDEGSILLDDKPEEAIAAESYERNSEAAALRRAMVESSPEKASVPTPPHGWLASLRIGSFLKFYRGNECRFMHEHATHYADCDWVGDDIKCRECGAAEKTEADPHGDLPWETNP